MVFEENIICLEHMKHMRPNFRESVVTAVHRPRTPSTACGRSPSLDEGGLGVSPVKACGLAGDCI